MIVIVAAKQIPCPVCGAEPGEECTYIFAAGGKRRRKFKWGCHSRRVWDAHDAQVAANGLLDQ